MREDMQRLEALAEKYYDAMYDARGREVKECYEDACGCLIQAIDAAKQLGLADEAERLDKRLRHIIGVYTHQFR